MSRAVFGTEIPATGALTDNHRAVVWSLAAATGPLSVDALLPSLDVHSLPCGAEENRRVKAWLTEILADLHQAGFVDIALDGRREHLADRQKVSAVTQAPHATITATEDGMELAAAMFID